MTLYILVALTIKTTTKIPDTFPNESGSILGAFDSKDDCQTQSKKMQDMIARGTYLSPGNHIGTACIEVKKSRQ